MQQNVGLTDSGCVRRSAAAETADSASGCRTGIPTAIPEITPSLFILFEKIPNIIAGNKDEAASPNARATTAATNPGGLIPK